MLLFVSSFLVLAGMCIYEIVTIVNNPQDFDDPDRKSACFQNRILLIAECGWGFAICIKDVLVFLYEKSK